ncbi:MAG: M4 family metallopeptidase [Novosphingobium sp.]|nr:M4 family metallopeptidase [Novosphingobium sp.]MCP5401956.1 M4 family metallopeptidase [Novosphingobium sp.]
MVTIGEFGRRSGFLPPYIVRRLHESENASLHNIAFDTRELDSGARMAREVRPARIMGRAAMPSVGPQRKVYDLAGNLDPLPGTLSRSEKGQPSGVEVVEEAFEHSGITYNFFKKVLKRESVDNAGHPLISSVNYGVHVANAFWNGVQMVYGSGDGHYFLPFTKSLGICAHEISHGVISFTTNLAYSEQSGALNESFCDVMAVSIEQWHLKQNAADANWALGREVAGPGLGQIDGFRTLTAAKAFEEHVFLGTDPQPKHLDGYDTTSDDHGGVHVNSGIPNHAFYLAAQELGGNVWERATPIWFEAFTGLLNQDASFVDAATATTLAAKRLFSGEPSYATAIADAWRAVGVQSEV